MVSGGSAGDSASASFGLVGDDLTDFLFDFTALSKAVLVGSDEQELWKMDDKFFGLEGMILAWSGSGGGERSGHKIRRVPGEHFYSCFIPHIDNYNAQPSLQQKFEIGKQLVEQLVFVAGQADFHGGLVDDFEGEGILVD